MIDVAVRLIAAFLAHPVHGVNAMAQSLPRAQFALAGDPVTTDDAPPIVAIYNDADHKEVAISMTPPDPNPALMVWGDSSRPASADNTTTAEDVVVAVAYVTKDSADDLTHNRACGYLMRGIRRSMRKFRAQSASAGYRELNGVRIMNVNTGDEQRITMAGEGDTPVVWGWIAIHARVVDGIA